MQDDPGAGVEDDPGADVEDEPTFQLQAAL